MAKNSEGTLIHFGAVRLRVKGEGTLLQFLHSLQNVSRARLTDNLLISISDREKVTLANFINQRAQYELRTIEKDEYFEVSKLVVFIRPTASTFPQ